MLFDRPTTEHKSHQQPHAARHVNHRAQITTTACCLTDQPLSTNHINNRMQLNRSTTKHKSQQLQIRMEVVSSRPNNLPTLSAAKTSKILYSSITTSWRLMRRANNNCMLFDRPTTEHKSHQPLHVARQTNQ